MNENTASALGWCILALIVAALIVAAAVGIPLYSVWSAEQHGRALYAEAESTRQIAILEANAKKDAAQSLADAEITRAQGVAKANLIIGDSLKGNAAYLDYLWITEKIGSDADKEVVYVPTEAQLPILEAQRLNNARNDPN